MNVSDPERWFSGLAGGALTAWGISKRTPLGFALAALGGGFVFRAVSGFCPMYRALQLEEEPSGSARPVIVNRTITVSKDPDEVYEFWRNFENLPRFMNHLKSVKQLDDKRSRWTARGPMGIPISWDAEITNENRGRVIEWQASEGSPVESSGVVRFVRKKNGKGTKVHVTFKYSPPTGILGRTAAKVIRPTDPEQKVTGDLGRFKDAVETA